MAALLECSGTQRRTFLRQLREGARQGAHALTVPEGAEGLGGAKAAAVSELRISKPIMGKTIVLGLAVPSLSLANYLIN